VATNRTLLPPLSIEVVAGGKQSAVHSSSKAKLGISTPESTPIKTADNFAAATNAAERESISASAQPRSASLEPSYPLLAQHMNVQGSVVLQAIIGADGIVQNLRVLSGPGILTTAAQQAVREWRFKPVLQNGQAVETKAKITVNFTIDVADGAAKTTLAESRTDGILILSR
jgi:TonB family protein